MTQVLDAASRIPAAAIRQDGYAGRIGYVAPPMGGRPNPKCITGPELADDFAHGLLVGIVFEQGAQNSLGGGDQGHIDGKIAVAAVRALGLAHGGVIYAAVDYNAPPADWPTIAAYLDAFRVECHGEGCCQGGYGKYELGRTMLADGHAEAWLESGAWSGDHRLQGTPGATLFQRIGSVECGGVTCDVNDVWAVDWGQWPRPSAPSTTGGDLLMAASKDDDDARRTLVRAWFREYLGRGFKPGTWPNGQSFTAVEEQALHVWIAGTQGTDVALAGILDSAEAKARTA